MRSRHLIFNTNLIADLWPRTSYSQISNHKKSICVVKHLPYGLDIPRLRSFTQSPLIVIDHTSICQTVPQNARLIAGSPVVQPVVWLVAPQSYAIDGRTLHYWLCDHVRFVCNLLWLGITNLELGTSSSTTLRQNLLVRSSSTSKTSHMMFQWFDFFQVPA